MPTYIFDDVYGDQRPGSYSPRVIYGPQWGLWDPVGGTCWGCTLGTDLPIAIESENATMGTWHTVTVQPGGQVANLSVTFTGTSINAYCILPPNFASPFSSSTSLSFMLDGASAGTFEWTGNKSRWTYNYSVFSREHLTQNEHILVISSVPAQGKSSYFAFDYFTYGFGDTNATDPSTVQPILPQSTPPAVSVDSTHAYVSESAAVSGGVAAGVALCVITLLAGLWYTWRNEGYVRLRKLFKSMARPGTISEHPGEQTSPTNTPASNLARSPTNDTSVGVIMSPPTSSAPSEAGNRPRLPTMAEYLAQRRANMDTKGATREAREDARVRWEMEYLRRERDRLRSVLHSGRIRHVEDGQAAAPPKYHADA